ncbi:MAG: DNA polymerase Y family protein [Proteobacteria bacterium]|nr:DNA polymerase Y family protein [Pseudomonadota bacterium]
MVTSKNSPTQVLGRRILALWFPRLATDRLQRRWKTLETQQASDPSHKTGSKPPLVVVTKNANALRLSAVDRKATSLGLSAGMPLANARAMLPTLKVMTANEPADLKLLERIADWCDRFSPLVALDSPRGLLLDISGAAHLYGGEQAMLDRIRALLLNQGFAVRGAIAGTIVSARALAHYKDGSVVPSGDEASATAPLAIEALNLDPITTHALRRAGLKTIGQVAKRKRNELNARFGAAMVATLDSALGRIETPISPRVPIPDYMAERRFAEPVVTEAIILETLQSLASSLGEILTDRGEGARRLEAAFFRSDGAVSRIAIETGHPTRDAAIIKRLLGEKLDALADPLDPGFGFDLIRLCATRAERAQASAIDFDTRENEKREIAFLIDRLAARFGSHRILSFQANDTHIPEAAALAVPAQYAEFPRISWQATRNGGEAPRRPLRLFERPEPVKVVRVDLPDSPPAQLRSRRVWHETVLAEGPERIAMEWWRHQRAQPTRDYFRVEDEEGRRFWLYREGIEGRETCQESWFMHGAFA